MAATMTEIQNLLRDLQIKALVSDDGEDLVVPYGGRHGKVHAMISCDNGFFLKLRSFDIPPISKDDPAAGAVHREIAAINYELRFLKVGLDPSDGEIVGCGDAWLADNGLTTDQLGLMLDNFLRAMDEAAWRIREAARTGKAKAEREFDALCDKLASSDVGP